MTKAPEGQSMTHDPSDYPTRFEPLRSLVAAVCRRLLAGARRLGLVE
jgi:hypothetical protein